MASQMVGISPTMTNERKARFANELAARNLMVPGLLHVWTGAPFQQPQQRAWLASP